MYKYLHDAKNRVVYQIPSKPRVIEQKDRGGKRTGWSINMEIRITRADNKLNKNQWLHPISSNLIQLDVTTPATRKPMSFRTFFRATHPPRANTSLRNNTSGLNLSTKK